MSISPRRRSKTHLLMAFGIISTLSCSSMIFNSGSAHATIQDCAASNARITENTYLFKYYESDNTLTQKLHLSESGLGEHAEIEGKAEEPSLFELKELEEIKSGKRKLNPRSRPHIGDCFSTRNPYTGRYSDPSGRVIKKVTFGGSRQYFYGVTVLNVNTEWYVKGGEFEWLKN